MDTTMQFELTMRLLFGDKAWHIADLGADPKCRREWLQKAVRKLLCYVDRLDTEHAHKQMLMAELEAFCRSLRRTREPSWHIVYLLLCFSMRLLGFDGVRGVRYYTPTYWQTVAQHYAGADAMQSYHDKRDAISVRRTVIEDLKSKGFDDFKISLVLNTTEYEVKQLRSDVRTEKDVSR